MGNSKMIKCKVCQADIAKSAKACPHCGAKLKKGHPILTGILVFFVLIMVISSAGGSDEPAKVETAKVETASVTTSQSVQTSSVKAEVKNEEKLSFAVGETAELRDVKVTLVSVTESTGSAYNKPTDGNVFVLCEFEIENDSDKEIAVSSMMSFDAYCDDYTCNYSLNATIEKGNKNQLDGTVAGGKKFNGVVGYEVAGDWKELEIIFTPDFWSGKDITFIATNN